MEYNMNSKHMYFLLVDKDIELSEYIDVFNVVYEHDHGSLWEPPYTNFAYDTEVDGELYQHIHMVNYAYGIEYSEELEQEVLYFSLDDKHYRILNEDSDNEFDAFVDKCGFAYPVECELDGWWDTEEQAKTAVEEYIENVAKSKAEAALDDPWRNYDY